MSTVSVILCIFNASSFLERCINSILESDFNDFSVIIVDDGSTDSTPDILRKYNDIQTLKIITNPKNLGLMVSRNIGVSKSNSDFILFTDADCTVLKNWIKELIRPFSIDNKIDIIGGKILDPPTSNYWSLTMKGIYSLSTRSGYTKKIFGCNMAFRRSFLIDNPFDETLKYGGDETDLCYRATKQNLKIYYQDSASVIHYHRASFNALMKQRFQLGIGNYYIRFKHGIFPYVSIKSIVLLAACTAFFFSLIVNRYYVYAINIFFILGALYSLRVLFEDLKSGRKDLFQILITFPGKILATIAEDAGYLFGILTIIYFKKVKARKK